MNLFLESDFYMKKLKLIVAYDGTDFYGWQIQPEKISVASTLEQAFYDAFGQKISLIGASRTDTGVHALGQVAIFRVEEKRLSFENMKLAWNNLLPKSILIRNLDLVDEKFHPCFGVLEKIYYYHLFLVNPLPFVARYGWYYRFIKNVDLEKFNKALQLYIGKHDFGSFCKVEEAGKSTVRTINDIKMEKLRHWNVLRVTIKGPGFLRFQIRRMIGYALDVARRKDLSVSYLKRLLENPDPKQILTKAEACGLCLRKVVYKK